MYKKALLFIINYKYIILKIIIFEIGKYVVNSNFEFFSSMDNNSIHITKHKNKT